MKFTDLFIRRPVIAIVVNLIANRIVQRSIAKTGGKR